MLRVPPPNWTPQGVESLEPAAEQAIRHAGNSIVVAGPGAGKTELLAQRACYLLQTGLCSRGTRILAISFKRDAARNLAARVEQRCGRVLARRFHSMTFDAFAKSLLDRFGPALPSHWRPTPDYRIDFWGERNVRDRLGHVPLGYDLLTAAEVASIPGSVYRTHVIGRPLGTFTQAPEELHDRTAESLWQSSLHGSEVSSLNFQMIGRLAEYLLTQNPAILAALRASYAFVFLDEFQDTTSIQYELTKTAFLGSGSTLTAVGDDKQSIMRWALALSGIFSKFRHDFNARAFPLAHNHRSASRLVEILGHLSKAIDVDCQIPEAMVDDTEGEGECRILVFPNPEREAEEVTELLEQWISKDGIDPREICILTRQQPDRYTDALRKTLSERDISSRIEEQLQALLAEPITELILNALKVAVCTVAPNAWKGISDFAIRLAGTDDPTVARRVSRELASFLKRLGTSLSRLQCDQEEIQGVLNDVVAYFGRSHIEAEFPQYAQGTYLDQNIDKLAESLADAKQGRSWEETIDSIEGHAAVPIMTVHKSKGLEYHSVIFLGLEDYPFRGFNSMQGDEAAAFFVAFSRAKQRVIFTFSRQRDGRRQEAAKVKPFYELLTKQGVQVEKFDP